MDPPAQLVLSYEAHPWLGHDLSSLITYSFFSTLAKGVNSLPLIHMACMAVAIFRATAVKAYLLPLRSWSFLPHSRIDELSFPRVMWTMAALYRRERKRASPRFEMLLLDSRFPD